MTNKNPLLLAILAVVLIMIVVSLNTQKHKNNKVANHVNTSTPCSVNPCIEIAEQSGNHYRLNDFRFVALSVDPRHCILFISLPDNVHRETCGNYSMRWTGPTNNEQQTGSSIKV